jgi:hypothetical protein
VPRSLGALLLHNSFFLGSELARLVGKGCGIYLLGYTVEHPWALPPIKSINKLYIAGFVDLNYFSIPSAMTNLKLPLPCMVGFLGSII